MLRSYSDVIRSHAAHVGLFVLLMAMSIPGQTFFLSLFTTDIEAKYSLSSGELGGIFAFATFAGAICLSLFGKLVDTISLASMVLATGIAMALGCSLLVLPLSSPLLLAIVVFCLRFTGQGLLLHIVNTAAVRLFPQQAGKMLALVGTLFSLISIAVPIVLVALVSSVGWEQSFAVVAILVVLGALIAAARFREMPVKASVRATQDRTTKVKPNRPGLAIMYRFCPVLIAFSFIFTGLLFHQSALAASKGWSLSWLASCFAIFALAKAAGSFFFGELIDRYGAKAIFPYFLAPMALGIASLAAVDSHYIAVLYLALFGVSAAIDIKLGTILWKELYPVKHIGYVRSKFEAIRIVATGLAPLVVGWLLDVGVGMDQLIVGFLVLACAAIGYGQLALGKLGCKTLR